MDLFSIFLTIAAGLLLVFAGRRFFWLAAGIMVFLFAFSIFQKYIGEGWLGITLAILLGIACAWLVITLIRSFSYLIGGLAGAVGLPILLEMIGVHFEWWLIVLIGALVGILLVKIAFNWGLIMMTVWAGAFSIASKISSWLVLNNRITLWIFISLLAAGILVQAAQLRRKA